MKWFYKEHGFGVYIYIRGNVLQVRSSGQPWGHKHMHGSTETGVLDTNQNPLHKRGQTMIRGQTIQLHGQTEVFAVAALNSSSVGL